MSKIAVVYWSGTGNTEMMAEEITGKLKDLGHEANLIFSDDFSADNVDGYEGFAFGCPAMGAEELEDSSFEPMFESVETSLGDKPVVLFGSYEWAEGEWMDTWKERCEGNNIKVIDTLIAYDTPDDEAIESCKKLAESLANSL